MLVSPCDFEAAAAETCALICLRPPAGIRSNSIGPDRALVDHVDSVVNKWAILNPGPDSGTGVVVEDSEADQHCPVEYCDPSECCRSSA